MPGFLTATFADLLELLDEICPHEHVAISHVFCDCLDVLLHCELDDWERTTRFLDILFILKQHSLVIQSWLHHHNSHAAERLAEAFSKMVVQVNIVALDSLPSFLRTDASNQVTTLVALALALLKTMFYDVRSPWTATKRQDLARPLQAVGWLQALQVRVESVPHVGCSGAS